MSFTIKIYHIHCVIIRKYGGSKLPKQTFFNLPEDKRQHLIEAVKQEFARAPLYEASIANIVKIADIPRGSFYQYFQDKEDAFNFLLNEQTKALKKKFFSLLEKNNGDLHVAIIELFQDTIENISKKGDLNFLKNAFIHVTHEIEDKFTRIFSDSMNHDQYYLLDQLIDKEKLNITEDKNLYHIIQIVTSVTLRNFVEMFAHERSKEEAMDNFFIEMSLLKDGLFK